MVDNEDTQLEEQVEETQTAEARQGNLRITSVEKEYLQSENGNALLVTVEIFSGEEVLETRKFHYPLGTTKKELKADLKRVLSTFNDEEVRKVENADQEKAEAQADKLIDDLTGMEL